MASGYWCLLGDGGGLISVGPRWLVDCVLLVVLMMAVGLVCADDADDGDDADDRVPDDGDPHADAPESPQRPGISPTCSAGRRSQPSPERLRGPNA